MFGYGLDWYYRSDLLNRLARQEIVRKDLRLKTTDGLSRSIDNSNESHSQL